MTTDNADHQGQNECPTCGGSGRVAVDDPNDNGIQVALCPCKEANRGR